LNIIPDHYQNHGLACRWVVLEMLGKILVEKKMISDIKESDNFPFKGMVPEHKARSLSLLENILRNMSTLDNMINDYLTQKTNIRVMNILRICSAEILIDKIAYHAAVDSAVRLAKFDKKLFRFSGLINAVCRKISKAVKDGKVLDNPSLSNDFEVLLKKAYRTDIIKKFGLAQASRPPLDLTLRDERLTKNYANLLDAKILPSGSLRLLHQRQVSKLAGYDMGDWWVQDFSASIPVRLLGDINGLQILDVCAAPGGKTMQLVANGAVVTAIEVSKRRSKLLSENLLRTGLMAHIKTEDICNSKMEELYDAVLVDAPCSSTGTIRRNCDLQFLEPLKRISGLVKQQKIILKKSMQFVKTGGRLIYCTCSLMPEEGEDIINQILKDEVSWKQLQIKPEEFGIQSDWIDKFGGLRLQPNFWETLGGMDGFYIAMLVKEK